MKKRILALLLASAMIFSIAACNNDSEGGGTTAGGGGGGTESTAGGGGGDGGDGDGGGDGGGGGGGEEETTTPDPLAGWDPAGEIPSEEELGGKTLINVYCFANETSDTILPFVYEQNPDFLDKYYVNIIMEATATTYIRKVEMALDTGSGIDLYVADADYARRFAANPKTAVASDYLDFNEDDYYKYTLDMMRVDGKVKALSHQATPGCMYYRSDIAAEAGYNSPADVQAAVSTWDGFLAVADAVTAQDNVFMTYGTDELKRTFLNSRDRGWVVNGLLSIDEGAVKNFFTTTKALYDKGQILYKGTGQWSAGWEAAARGQTEDGSGSASAFAYFGCTWYLHYCLKGWTIADADAAAGKTDQEIADSGNGTFGKWGMVDGPQGFFWGGTYWYAPTFLVNGGDADVLAGVKIIIETMCVNDETMKAYAFKTGDFMSKKTVVEAIKNDEQFNNPFLGGQNHYVTFATAALAVDASKNVTTYDARFDEFFNEAVNTFFKEIDGGKSFDDAYNTTMTAFVGLVKTGLPDVDVSSYDGYFA
ncbi:MAG: hypothetical protein LBI38_05730 [Oscillospiraceae bacterium]|nr:hypothetical protein [Oscillospiraceae bacterium]